MTRPKSTRASRVATSAAIAALLLATPVVAEDASDYTTMYGHVFATMREGSGYYNSVPNPLNTVFPSGEEDFSRGGGFLGVYGDAGSAVECQGVEGAVLTNVAVGNCDPRYDVAGNEAWFFLYDAEVGFSTTDEVEAAGGIDAFTGEKKLLKDIRFDAAKPFQTEVYMSADATLWFGWSKGCTPAFMICDAHEILQNETLYQDLPWPYPSWNLDYGVYPGWTVFSKLYAVSPAATAGLELAQVPNAILENETSPSIQVLGAGESQPFDMMSLPTTVGGQVVYAFHPEMGTPQAAKVPADHSLWWWIDWYGKFEGNEVLWGQNYALNSGEFFPPSVGLPIENPIDIEMVMPQFVDGGRIVIIALFNSPFGQYDVPLEAASFEILGPDGKVVTTSQSDTVTWMQKAARDQQALLGVSVEAALARGQATWLWNYLWEPDIKPGEYTIRVRAENLQGHSTEREAFFTLEEGLVQGEVTSSLGGMFTFSTEDIKEIEECHGCHDPATGELRDGVSSLTKAEMEEALQQSQGTDAAGSGDKDTPAPGAWLLPALGLAALLRRRRSA